MLTALLLREVQVFCLLLCKKGTGLPPCSMPVGVQPWPRALAGAVSSHSVAPVQALAAVRHTSQGTVTDRVRYSSAQGMEVSNAFWTALLQTGRGTAPPVNVIKTNVVPFIAISGCQVINLGAGGRGKECKLCLFNPCPAFPLSWESWLSCKFFYCRFQALSYTMSEKTSAYGGKLAVWPETCTFQSWYTPLTCAGYAKDTDTLQKVHGWGWERHANERCAHACPGKECSGATLWLFLSAG